MISSVWFLGRERLGYAALHSEVLEGGRDRVYARGLGSASYKAGDLGKGTLFLWLSLLNYKMKGVG